MKNLMDLLRMSLACGVLVTLTAATAWAAGPPIGVPEIDASIAGGAVALLVGGYLVIVSRWRRK